MASDRDLLVEAADTPSPRDWLSKGVGGRHRGVSGGKPPNDGVADAHVGRPNGGRGRAPCSPGPRPRGRRRLKTHLLNPEAGPPPFVAFGVQDSLRRNMSQ